MPGRSRRVPTFLKGHWTDIFQRLMQSSAVVKAQPVNDFIHGRSAGGKTTAIQPYHLQVSP